MTDNETIESRLSDKDKPKENVEFKATDFIPAVGVVTHSLQYKGRGWANTWKNYAKIGLFLAYQYGAIEGAYHLAKYACENLIK